MASCSTAAADSDADAVGLEEAGLSDGFVDDAGIDARDADMDVYAEYGDDSCVYDCFGYLVCKDGVVVHWWSTLVPCYIWRERRAQGLQCPFDVAFQCPGGCEPGIERVYVSADPASLCADVPQDTDGDGSDGDSSVGDSSDAIGPDLEGWASEDSVGDGG